jgi:hypothetical protein
MSKARVIRPLLMASCMGVVCSSQPLADDEGAAARAASSIFEGADRPSDVAALYARYGGQESKQEPSQILWPEDELPFGDSTTSDPQVLKRD